MLRFARLSRLVLCGIDLLRGSKACAHSVSVKSNEESAVSF